MRTLTETLLAAQKSPDYAGLWKIVLTKTGETTRTYGIDSIINIDHVEEPYDQHASVVLDNSEGGLTSLDLKGYQAVINYGMTTSAGDEYSATAPLKCLAMNFSSSEGRLLCTLESIGLPNMLAEDRARVAYVPLVTDTKTVKTIISDMFDGTMDAFDLCPTYTISWDSEDSLIDTYIPKDTFRIYLNGSRLAALRRLLDWTKCVCRFENDGKIHIFVPTVSGDTWVKNTAYVLRDFVQPTTPNNNFTYRCTTAGTSHATTEPTWPVVAGGTVTDGNVVWTAVALDYEYSLADDSHTFFSKAYRKRLVIPNKITVESQPDDAVAYTGSATDADSYAAIGFYITQFEQVSLTSNAQAVSIAKAILVKYQMQAEAGAADVPMNVGAELYDYVKVTDTRENDVRIGNIGHIRRRIVIDLRSLRLTKCNMEFSFGGWLSVRSLMNNFETNPSGFGSAGQYFNKIIAKDLYVENIHADSISLIDLDDITDGTTYEKVKATSISGGNIQLNSYTSISGEWYDKSGVEIDADTGINIYGTNNALVTRATKTGTIQCSVNASGQITAGAGAVILDATGLTITGANLFIYRDSGSTATGLVAKYGSGIVGYIYPVSGAIAIGGGGGVLIGSDITHGVAIEAGGFPTSTTEDVLDLAAMSNIVIDSADVVKVIGYDGVSISGGAAATDPENDDVIIETTDDLWLYGAISIQIKDPAYTDDLDAETLLTNDIGSVNDYDNIYCDKLYYTGGSLPDDKDDIQLLKVIQVDENYKIRMSTLPDFVRINHDSYMVERITKLDARDAILRQRFTEHIARIDDRIGNAKCSAKHQRALADLKVKLQDRLEAIGEDRVKQLNFWEQRYKDVSNRSIPVNEMIALNTGALRQIINRLEAIETKVKGG